MGGVEVWRGGLDVAYLFPTLSSVGASLAASRHCAKRGCDPCPSTWTLMTAGRGLGRDDR
jgi:hypothetical protein